MVEKITTEIFIERAKKIHGDKYDYSKVEYVSSKKKVCIICPIHGEFWQTLDCHCGRGQGCRKCGLIRGGSKLMKSTNTFVKKSKIVHNDYYDYSKTEYIGGHKKLCIICPVHGEFWQEANSHLNGKGCAKCFGNLRKNTEQFIEEGSRIHNNFYDYSKAEYTTSHRKVCIICPVHGEFWQTPSHHLNGCGCIKCCNRWQYSTKEYIEKAISVHGDMYDYSKVEYVNAKGDICIICQIHGEFKQKAYSHLNGNGCPICKEPQLEKNVRITLTDNNIEFESQKRFEWLGRQSLDFYIPSINVAIECQGGQHFKEVKRFGGEKTFKVNQKRDINKKILCEKHGIKLLYYSDLKEYDTFLGENLIKNTEDLLNEIKNNGCSPKE